MTRYDRSTLAVRWIGGGIYLESVGEGLLLDVPDGAASALETLGALPKLRAILSSGGRIPSIGGLVPLLCALEPHRSGDAPLRLWSPLGEERVGLLADAWSKGWGGRYPLSIEAEVPGSTFDVGRFSVQTRTIRRGEARFHPSEVLPVAAVGFRVECAGVTVAWVPGAAPGAAVGHLCRGADLAVVEVGVKPWPPSREPWRMTLNQAITAAGDAAEVWLVGDDGRLLGGEAD